MGLQQAGRHRQGHRHAVVGEKADDGDHAHANLAHKQGKDNLGMLKWGFAKIGDP